MKFPFSFKRAKPARKDKEEDSDYTPVQSPSLGKPRRESRKQPQTRIVVLPPDPTFAKTRSPHSSPIPTKRNSSVFNNFESKAEAELRVLIVGTGFAGLSSAIACALQGFQVTVLERTNGASQHGDSVIIGANAVRLLYRWGVEDLWERASQGKWLVFKDQAGRTLWQEDLSALPSQYGAPILQGKRSQFLGSLGVAARMLGVAIEYSSEVVGYVDSDTPAAYLSSGEMHTADVIIVADGVNSTSRCLLAENSEQRRSGFSIYRAVMESSSIAWDPDCSYLLDGNIRTYLGKDEWIQVFPIDAGRQIAFTYTHRDADCSSTSNWRSSVPISSILHRLTDWDVTLQKAISKFPRALNWTIQEGSVAESWISRGGKIAFAGDAVHPLIPSSLQGATMAIEDAETLAQCFSLAGGTRDGDSVKLALKVYEKLRKPRVEQAARLGRKQAMIYQTFTSRNASSPTQTRHSSFSGPASSTSSFDDTPQSSAFSVEPRLLTPLAFQMYGFDAEEFIKERWDSTVRELDATISKENHKTDVMNSPRQVENEEWQDEKKGRRNSFAFMTESFTNLGD